ASRDGRGAVGLPAPRRAKEKKVPRTAWVRQLLQELVGKLLQERIQVDRREIVERFQGTMRVIRNSLGPWQPFRGKVCLNIRFQIERGVPELRIRKARKAHALYEHVFQEAAAI